MEDIDNKDSFNYEYKELKVYQILETDREIHHIHIPSNEINNLQRFINNNKSTKITEREITGLYEYIINYLERGFSYNVGERLKYSYENYTKTKCYISMVFKMPNIFKKSKIINEKLSMFRHIRMKLRKNKDEGDIHVELVNKFNKMLKWGRSFPRPKESQTVKIEVDNKEIDKNSYTYCSLLNTILTSFIPNKFKKNLVSYCLERIFRKESDSDTDSERKASFFFTNHENPNIKQNLNSDILRHTEPNKFFIIIETFLLLFFGIKTKYYIDELGLLNMDLFASDNQICFLAEKLQYQLQFKILSLAERVNFDNKVSDNDDLKDTLLNSSDNEDQKLINVNKVNFEDLDINDVTFFPPYSNFNRRNIRHFRRYDSDDRYHACLECYDNDNVTVPCKASLFRFIDKTRLIYSAVKLIFDTSKMRNERKNDKGIKKFIDNIFLYHDYDELDNKIEYTDLIKIYANPLETKEIMKYNNLFRNSLGEEIGFYFFWVSHYIKFLIFPALLSFIVFVIGNILDWMNQINIYLYMNLLFASLVMLWANYYIRSWKSKEKFLRYIWGMNTFKIDRSSEKSTKTKFIKIMDVKIPIYKTWELVITKIVSFFLMICCVFITISVNLFIFYIENSQLYSDYNSWLGKLGLVYISTGYWLYIIPIITFIIREFISSFNDKAAGYITDREFHMTKTDKRNSKLTKKLTLEFFNYYFNLYYIAFVKRYYESCVMGDCAYELSVQLRNLIFLNLLFSDGAKLFWYAIHKRNKVNQLEKSIKNSDESNSSVKYIYHTRETYEREDFSEEFREVLLSYGYIIQFGCASPLCFIMSFIQILIGRLVDVIKVTKLQYMRFINESLGTRVYIRFFKTVTFLGLISNISIIFFTNNRLINTDYGTKLAWLFSIENIVMAILIFISYNNLPSWFEFKDKIEINYLKKYAYFIDDNIAKE